MRSLRTAAALLAVASLATVAAAAPLSAAAQPDIVETAASAGTFRTLETLLKRAGLVRALEQRGPYTVFAPTDAAFAKVPKKTIDGLLANRAKLKAVLLYHVVAGKVTAADVAKLETAKTVNGKRVRVRVAGSKLYVNTARVIASDVTASNGVIHVVNRVLIPPSS
jgi:uncharacterized surface protein with fasciclin (FAS1) repeats